MRSYQTGKGLRVKRAFSVAKHVRKQALSNTVGGNGNCFNSFGRQLGNNIPKFKMHIASL